MTYLPSDYNQLLENCRVAIMSNLIDGHISQAPELNMEEDFFGLLSFDSSEDLQEFIISAVDGSESGDITECSSERMVSLECQLCLLQAVVAIESNNEHKFSNAIKHAMERACFVIQEDASLVDSLYSCACILGNGDAFWRQRLTISATKFFSDQGEKDLAKKWLSRFDHEDQGIFADAYQRLSSILLDEPDVR